MGDVLRWQRKAGGAWKELRVRGLNRDGSLNLYDPHYGYCRAWRLNERAAEGWRFEVKSRGPRGGVVWLPITVT